MATIRQRRLRAEAVKSSQTFRISGNPEDIEKVECSISQCCCQAQNAIIEMFKVQLSEYSWDQGCGKGLCYTTYRKRVCSWLVLGG